MKFKKNNVVLFKKTKNEYSPDLFVIVECFEEFNQYNLQNISTKKNIFAACETELMLHQLPKKFIAKCS